MGSPIITAGDSVYKFHNKENSKSYQIPSKLESQITLAAMKARFSIVFVVDFERDNYCYTLIL